MSDRGSKKPFGWADNSQVRKEEFAELLNTPAFKDVFNEKYVEALERRRDFLVARTQTIWAIASLISVVVVVAVLSAHMSVSLFGILAVNPSDLREVLLVILFTLSAYDTYCNVVETRYINELIDIYIHSLSKANDAARRALQVRYGFGARVMMNRSFGSTAPTPSRRLLIMMLIATIGFLSIVMCAFLVMIAAMVDIIIHPTISTTVSVFVVAYCILTSAMQFIIHAFSGTLSAETTKG
jgi:hypothetical protein